jgi:hypothetical protein
LALAYGLLYFSEQQEIVISFLLQIVGFEVRTNLFWHAIEALAIVITFVSISFFCIGLLWKFHSDKQTLSPPISIFTFLFGIIAFCFSLASLKHIEHLEKHIMWIIALFALVCLYEIIIVYLLTQNAPPLKFRLSKWKKELWDMSTKQNHIVSNSLRNAFDNFDFAAFIAFIVLLIFMMQLDEKCILWQNINDSYRTFIKHNLNLFELVASGAFAFHMILSGIQVIKDFYETLKFE